MGATEQLRTLARSNPSVRTGWRGMADALEAIERAENTLVRLSAQMRRHGCSWDDIAAVIGVSPDTARRRYGGLL